MERDSHSHPDSVIARLKHQPWRFSLEQCVRLLTLAGEKPALRGFLGTAFAPAEVGSVRDGRIQVCSQGPGGADGVLSYGWLESLQQAKQDKNTAPQDFIDLFQQRFLHHHYRSLSHYRLATPYGGRHDTPACSVMRALCGNPSSAREHYALATSGLLANRRRPVRGFIALVASTLRVHIRIDEFIGRWQRLPGGRSPLRLGHDAVAGRRAWNQHALLQLHLEAESETQWRGFLPDGESFRQLQKLGHLWFGPGISLVLALSGVAPQDCHLKRHDRPLLGRTARLLGHSHRPFCCRLHITESDEWS